MVRQRSIRRKRSVRTGRRGVGRTRRKLRARKRGTRSGSGWRKLGGSDLSTVSSNEFEFERSSKISTDEINAVHPHLIIPENHEPPDTHPFAPEYKPRGWTKGLSSMYLDSMGTEWRKPRAEILMDLYKKYRRNPAEVRLPSKYDKETFINWQYQNIKTICEEQGIYDLQIPTRVSEDTLYNWQLPSPEFSLPTISSSGRRPTNLKSYDQHIPAVYPNEPTDLPVMGEHNERYVHFGTGSKRNMNTSSLYDSNSSVSSQESHLSDWSTPSNRSSASSVSSARSARSASSVSSASSASSAPSARSARSASSASSVNSL